MFKSFALLRKHCKSHFWILNFCTLAIGVSAPINTYLLKKLLENVNLPFFGYYMGAYIASLAFVVLCNYLKKYVYTLAECKLTKILNKEMLNIFSSANYSDLESPAVNDSISRMGTPAALVMKSYSVLILLLQNVISYTGILSIFFSASVVFALLSILLFTISFIFNFKEIKGIRNLQFHQTATERKRNYFSNLFLDKVVEKEIKIFGLSSYLLGIYDDISAALIKERMVIRRRGFKNGLLPLVATLMFNTFCVIYLLFLGKQSIITLAEIIALISALPTLSIMSGWTFPSLLGELDKYKIPWQDYKKLGTLLTKKSSDSLCHETSGDIIFENVYFKYPNTETYILNGINFTIKRGQTTAIVGENGCGKSTIVKLLLGLYLPERGEIKIGKTPLQSLSRKERLSLITAVLQKFCIYQIPVKNNIEIADPSSTSGELKLEEIKRGTSFLDDITLTSRIGEIYPDGISLSGGQNQRVALSRALYSSAEFCILDEPTASVDPLTESSFYEMIHKNNFDKSLVIISHRLPSAKLADTILLIKEGKVKEYGSHEDLMKLNGIYFEMFTKQACLYQK